MALAAIEAFFGWTEHIFIHLAIIQGYVTTGAEVAAVAQSDWGDKFKKVFNLNDRVTKRHFDVLVVMRRHLRNFVAHGAFGKEGEAFSFHSEVGAVPVVIDYKLSKPQFSFTPELAFENEQAIIELESFITFMWSGEREPAKIYIQESNLPLVLPHASDGTYKAAMTSVQHMIEHVNYMSNLSDRATNMDW